MSIKVENLSYVYMQGTPFETVAVDTPSRSAISASVFKVITLRLQYFQFRLYSIYMKKSTVITRREKK